MEIACEFFRGDEKDVKQIVSWATARRIDLAVIGLEDPLFVGLPDALQAAGIPTVGPIKAAARVETSKLFLRELMQRHQIAGRVEYKFVTDVIELDRFLKGSNREFALKPVGLTAGKGVKVMGVQLKSHREAIEYGRAIIRDEIGGVAGVVLEERLQGPEFTLQAFVDGYTVSPMPIVKDYKLAYDGDWGPNTGSMGSYSQADGSLHFVTNTDKLQAVRILEAIVAALRSEGVIYKGIMYGQFMQTRSGPKLIEINARFGDPEGINVLSLLRTDFVDICDAICQATLSDLPIRFDAKATVCKYITPPGYPDHPKEDEPITLNRAAIAKLGVNVFFAKVDLDRDGRYRTTTSRSIALLGIADTLEEANLKVDAALDLADGDFHVRRDIGTKKLIIDCCVSNRTV